MARDLPERHDAASAIPDFWKQGIDSVAEMPFMGTSISLNKAYDISYRHAEEMISKNGGEVRENEVVIRRQAPATIPLEISFEGHYPVSQVTPVITNDEIFFEFEGIGFAVVGPSNIRDYGEKSYVFQTEMYIDGSLVEKVRLPTAENRRRFTPFWKYQLPRGRHKVLIKILNPIEYAKPEIRYAIIYDDRPYEVKL